MRINNMDTSDREMWIQHIQSTLSLSFNPDMVHPNIVSTAEVLVKTKPGEKPTSK